MIKLKPCPFCGGEAEMMDLCYPHWVYCTVCGARVHGGVYGEDGELASAEAWNKRANDGSEQQWIPVSERLPGNLASAYWICTDTGYQCECRWTNKNMFWPSATTDWHWNIFDIPQYTKVVAWMPLPPAFKEEE